MIPLLNAFHSMKKGMETNHTISCEHSKKVYTRSGDNGKTSLLETNRVSKHDLRIQTNGMIDELNSWIGYVRAIDNEKIVEDMLARLQPRLNTISSDIATSLEKNCENKKTQQLLECWSRELETEIDCMAKDLLTLSHLILPGGSPIGASLHLARAVCRRVELLLVHLQEEKGNVYPETIRFINRLSDFLFMLARWANHRIGVDDNNYNGDYRNSSC